MDLWILLRQQYYRRPIKPPLTILKTSNKSTGHLERNLCLQSDVFSSSPSALFFSHLRGGYNNHKTQALIILDSVSLTARSLTATTGSPPFRPLIFLILLFGKPTSRSWRRLYAAFDCLPCYYINRHHYCHEQYQPFIFVGRSGPARWEPPAEGSIYSICQRR